MTNEAERMRVATTRRYRGLIGVLLDPIDRMLRGRGLHRIRALSFLARRWHRFIWLLTRTRSIVLNGHDVMVDPMDSLCLTDGKPYEPEETAWYLETVRPGQLVVEVGANIGYFTLILARALGDGGQLVCYEPDPQTADILRRNLRVNGYPWVEVREAAAADSAGLATFYRSIDNQGDNRLHSHGADASEFQVRTVRLDDDLAGLTRRIDLLKMDIQGAEPLALSGFAHTLATRPPRRILMEWWPSGISRMGHDARAVVEQLRTYGYQVRALGADEDLDLDHALIDATVDNEEWLNLVCTHEVQGSDT